MKGYLLLTLVVGSHAFFPTGKTRRMEDDYDDAAVDLFGDVDYGFKEIVPETTTQPSNENADEISKKCGMRRSSPFFKAIDDRILPGAKRAHFAEFNWAVPIFEVLWNGTEKYTCVGSLIHPQVALSVAHYYQEKKNWLIRAGDWDVAETGELEDHQSIYVSEVARHPQFKKSDFRYDVALLFLASPVTSGPHVGFTCLPPAESVTPAGANCIVTGWGQEQFKDDKTVNVLKMAEVPVVPNDQCEETLREPLTQAFNLHKSFMCAGGITGKDACLRDGGGPLVCPYANSPNQYYQAGIVSWGHHCGKPGIPGVYARVSKVRQWIDDKMAEKGFTADTYTP